MKIKEQLKTTRQRLEELTISELQKELNSVDFQIYQVQCYGVSDMQYEGMIYDEIERRGIEVIPEARKVRLVYSH